MMRLVAEKVSWDENKTKSISDEMINIFGTLYGALEECAISENALSDAGFEGDWIKEFIEVAIENIIPDFVEVRGTISLSINSVDGIEVIRNSLLAAENFSSEKDSSKFSSDIVANHELHNKRLSYFRDNSM